MANILYIITRLDRGGSAEAVMQWAEGIKNLGHRTKIVTGKTVHPQEDFHTYTARTGVPIDVIHSLVRPPGIRCDYRALKTLIRLIRNERPHIVHTNTSKAGILGRFAARINKVPVIIHSPHGHIFYGYFSKAKTKFFIGLERWAAGFTHQITNLTRLGMEDHIRLRVAPSEKLRVIYPGVELGKYAVSTQIRGQIRCGIGISDETTVIGWVGRIDSVKNPLMFIQAAVLLKDKNLHFLLVGDGELMESMRRKVDEMSLNEKFTFTGHRTDIPNLLAAMDIYVLTSLNEGFGRTIIEAQSANLPVIVTDVGGVSEIVIDGETGILIPSEDPSALAQAILRLTGDSQLQKRLIANARKRLKRFSLQNTIDNIENLYRELLSSYSAEPS